MAQALAPKASLNDTPSLAAVANNVGVLPTDLLFEVLLRLPADELCRLRLVCRSWRSLTCNPLFAKAHTSWRAYVLALGTRLGEVHVVDLMCGNTVKRMRVVGEERMVYMSSQHDLVVVSPAISLAATAKNPCVFSLVTGAAAEIPHPHGTWEFAGATLLCHPRYILGHVSSTGEYKILCVAHLLAKVCASALSSHVTTLVAGDDTVVSWRATTPPPVFIAVVLCRIETVDGVAYFLEFVKHSSTTSSTEEYDITLFDFATEQWRMAPLRGPPASLTAGTSFAHLSRLGSCLVAVHSNCKAADLWFLEDTANSVWTKRYTMQYASPFECHGPVHPLLVLGDGRVAIWVDRARIVRVYDPGTSTWTNMATSEDFSSVSVCQGSLLCSGILNHFIM